MSKQIKKYNRSIVRIKENITAIENLIDWHGARASDHKMELRVYREELRSVVKKRDELIRGRSWE